MAGRAEYDIIVLGVGAMGTACCLELARRGERVLGVERFTIGHALGSSHGESRIFRVAYYEHPDYVPLLQRARKQWLTLQEQAGETLFHPSGGLWIGPPDHHLIAGTLDTAGRHGLPHEVLDAGSLVSRYPFIRPMPDDVGFFEQDAGTLLPERAVTAMARLAREAGAAILDNTRALHWREQDDEVIVITDRGEFRAGHLILSAGAWSSDVIEPRGSVDELRDAERRGSSAPGGLALRVSRQPAVWFAMRDPIRFRPRVTPCWGVARAVDSFYYGFPCVNDHGTGKVSLHFAGETCDPETLPRRVRPDEIAALKRFLDLTFPGVYGEAVASSVCLYTNSPDGHFIIDRHPIHRRVTIACGFSGHGFKFAPVVGEALADLATRGRTDLPIGFLAAARFRA
ncbi:MAG: N-methyl-L-tryptophan oxidase [Phycisphaeraceae bacterium]|nr:N-methyl-L-tryptophan oxidase [Phycisphaerales bacterium]QOJ17416.1 MAG: N-methyl-L-tryptophan oxidase [Phycisphaeraceae bacterium]